MFQLDIRPFRQQFWSRYTSVSGGVSRDLHEILTLIISHRDLSELRGVDKDRRRQLVDAAVKTEFWSLPSLTVTLALAGTSLFAMVAAFSNDLRGASFVPAIVISGSHFLYHLIGINSFLRRSIVALRDTLPPPPKNKTTSPLEFCAVMCFVLLVIAGLLAMLSAANFQG